MNCHQAQDNLLEWVYDELPDDARAEVEHHLAGCPACREELAQLQWARQALAQGRLDEPADGPSLPATDNPQSAAGGARRPRWSPALLTGAVAAAAALAVGVWLWLQQGTQMPVQAQMRGPIEIRRTGVSLTILSQPADWPGPFTWNPAMSQTQVTVAQSLTQMPVPPNGQSWQVGTDANNVQILTNYRMRSYGWPGMALVRDQRIVRNLPKGKSTVRLTGVPSGILPDTVRLRGIDAPDGLAILEQNYQYDLASAGAVLHRYIDKPISLLLRSGQTAKGVLLSYGAASVTLQPAGQGPRTVAADQIRSVTLAKLPAGLLTQPTLVWHLANRTEAAQQFEVAYMTHGLTWRADYVLKLRPAKVQPGGPGATIIDTADLVGYATVMNRSGVTYERAQLKLMAGDVNLIRPAVTWELFNADDVTNFVGVEQDKRHGFQEKSFFEYHLYTLGRPATIRSDETKQIELLTAAGVRMRRGYVYDPGRHKSAVQVVHEFKNSKANRLGKPLPKGVVRLYAPDPEGLDTFAGQTTIDHTPVNEKLRVPWGWAFDIVGEATRTDYRRQGNDHRVRYEYRLRNHKPRAVTVTLIVRVPKSTYEAECKRPWHIREAGVIEIPVTLVANTEEKVTFSYSYNNHTGGGFESPFDNDEPDAGDARN